MDKYEALELNVVEFETNDVLADSNDQYAGEEG